MGCQMDTGGIIAIALSAVGIVVGIIGFFLKRTINQSDKLAERVGTLESCKASKEEVCELRDEVTALERTTGEIKTNYLTKEDFFREQAKTDRKLDRIMEILLDIKGGGSKNG